MHKDVHLALFMPGLFILGTVMHWEQLKCPALVKHETGFLIFSPKSEFLPRLANAINGSSIHSAVQVSDLGLGILFYFFIEVQFT